LYAQRDSLLHRLNPLSKIAATAPAVIFLALSTDPFTPVPFVVLGAVVTLALGNVPPRSYLRGAAPLLLAMAGLALLYPFAVTSAATAGSRVVLDVGWIELREAGVVLGLSAALRILAVFALMLIVRLDHRPPGLRARPRPAVRSALQARVRGRGGLPPRAALCRRRSDHTSGAHGEGGLGGTYERLRRYSVPLLAGAVRHAERVALAMDSRAFGAHERRTYLRRLRLARPDLAFVALFWLASLALVLLLHLPGTL
jgi:energy-coupling factor transport system permease protein